MHPGMKHSITPRVVADFNRALRAAASELSPPLARLEGEAMLQVRAMARVRVTVTVRVRIRARARVRVRVRVRDRARVKRYPNPNPNPNSNSRRASTCRAPRRPSMVPATAGTSGHTSTSRCSTRSSTCCSRRWRRAPCAHNRDRPRRCSLMEAVLTPCCPLIEAKLLSGCTLSTYGSIYVPI